MINKEKTMCIVLSWKREKNLTDVVQGLKKQSCIDDILVFHNYPSSTEVKGCKNIFSKTNLGCVARHDLACEFDNYKYFLFSDDDFAFTRDLSDGIANAALGFGDKSIIGVVGHNLNLKNIEKSYSTGKTLRRDNITPVDIVKGRFHIMSKENIHILHDSGLDAHLFRKQDDLRANLAIQRYYKVPSFIFPSHKNDIRELDDSHALNKQPGHYEERDQVIMDGIEAGWETINKQ